MDYSKPFRVRIIEDCRRDAWRRHDGAYGICLGLYDYPHIDRESPDGNPLIIMDDGGYIWGCECWWAEEEWSKDEPLDKLQSALDSHKRNILRQALIKSPL